MEGLFSSRWYRVAGVHPRLRSHVHVSRHVYRGQVWYLLQDQSSGRHHRVDEIAFQFIGRMDGQRFEIADAGHLCNIEKPEVFNDAVLAFLEKHRGLAR